MHRSHDSCFGLVLTAAMTIALGAAGVGAQQQNPNQAVPPLAETVEVVATRRPEVPHEVSAAIEVIPGDTLRAMNARTLPQALALASGVDVTAGGDAGPAGSVPEFRGLREFDAFLLVVDGVPWGGAFNPALTTLNMRDIERVEILRGPAPVTFGATSFVGVIHVVHKPGSERRRYADARLGTHGSGGAGVDVALPAFGGWTSRLTVDGERRGFQDDRTSFGRGHALWRASSQGNDRRAWMLADINVLRQNPASPSPREGRALTTRVPLDANHNPAGAFLDDTRLSFTYGFERPVHGGKRWNTTASLSHSTQDLFRGFLGELSGGIAAEAHGLRQKIDITDVYADSHVSWSAPRGITLVAGGDLLAGIGNSKGAAFAYDVPLSGAAVHVPEPPAVTIRSEDRRVFSGGYALVEWRPNRRVIVSGGLRLNVTLEKRGEGEPEAERSGEEEAAQTNVRPGGSAGLLVSLWERGANHLRAYGSYRSTFKPAAFDFGLGEDEEEAGRLLEPETAENYEGGLKLRTLNGRLDVEMDVFRLDFENLVTAAVVNGLPALVNSGATRFKGIELATDWRLPHAVTGRVTYGFHDARFVDFVRAFDGVPTQLAGKRFEMSPRNLFGANIIYSPARGVFGTAAARYRGSRFLDKRNRALAAGYAVVDAGTGFRASRWELRVDGRNLADRRDPVSESELGEAQYYRLEGRHVELTIGVRF